MAQPPAGQVGRWRITKKIGKGSFATVWRGKLASEHATAQESGSNSGGSVQCENPSDVAIKDIDTSHLTQKLRQNLDTECALMQQMDHGNICRCLEVLRQPPAIYLVLEYCNYADLQLFMQRRKEPLQEGHMNSFLRQLAAGMRHLRKHGIVHRDLKPANLLLHHTEKPLDRTAAAAMTMDQEVAALVLKIADFGFAKFAPSTSLAETMCGSPLYMAPVRRRKWLIFMPHRKRWEECFHSQTPLW